LQQPLLSVRDQSRFLVDTPTNVTVMVESFYKDQQLYSASAVTVIPPNTNSSDIEPGAASNESSSTFIQLSEQALPLPASSILLGTTSVMSSNGIAAFTDLEIGVSVSCTVLRFQIVTLAGSIASFGLFSPPLEVSIGTPNQLVVLRQPAGVLVSTRWPSCVCERE
jgi:hypothetical protein